MLEPVTKVSVNEDYYPHCKYLPSYDVVGYEGDPFTSVDGHFVGQDGFVVPNSYLELEEQNPSYVRSWVVKRTKRHPSDVVVEDLTSELTLHLRILPEVSKYRDRGFVDIVDTFNPWNFYGASARRFFGYINCCLNNKYLTLLTKGGKDGLGNVQFSLDQVPDGDSDQVAESFESFVHDNSPMLRAYHEKQEEDLYKKLFVDRFISYVESNKPELVDTLEAIMYFDGNKDMTYVLDVTSSKFQRNKKALIQLGGRYLRNR